MQEPRVLLIGGDASHVQSTLEALNAFPQRVLAIESASDLAEGFCKLDKEAFDAVLLDLELPDAKSLESLHKTRLAAPELPIVVLISGEVSDLPLRAIKSGAQDYLVRGTFDGLMLARTIRYAIDRMKALHALLESEERFWALYDHIDIAVLEMDAEGRPTSANPAFFRMIEHSTMDGLTAAVRDGSLFHPDEFRAWLTNADRNSRRPITLRLTTATSRPILVSSTIHELRARDGKLIGYQALFRDITEDR